MLDSRLLRLLQTPAGREALGLARGALQQDPDFLRASQIVARSVATDLARAAVEQEVLRLRAAPKFRRAHELFFSREALEQATGEEIAQARARRFVGAPLILDLGCGLGGDALALSEAAPVIAVDRDRLRLDLLRANAAVRRPPHAVSSLQADLRALPLRPPARSLGFADPGRRRGGGRLHGVGNYDPPLSDVARWADELAGLAVKVSPAIRLAEVDHLACEVEFVSLGRELKEAVLWFGGLRRGQRRATILPEGVSLEGATDEPAEIGPLQSILLEPDPAVLRARQVHRLAAQLGARAIAQDISFLTCDRAPDSPLVRAYRVLEAGPFRLRTLRETLRRRNVGTVTIKRRGSAVEPEALMPRLRLEGDGEALVILTRIAGRQTMILAEPLPGSPRSAHAHQGDPA